MCFGYVIFFGEYLKNVELNFLTFHAWIQHAYITFRYTFFYYKLNQGKVLYRNNYLSHIKKGIENQTHRCYTKCEFCFKK